MFQTIIIAQMLSNGGEGLIDQWQDCLNVGVKANGKHFEQLMFSLNSTFICNNDNLISRSRLTWYMILSAV